MCPQLGMWIWMIDKRSLIETKTVKIPNGKQTKWIGARVRARSVSSALMEMIFCQLCLSFSLTLGYGCPCLCMWVCECVHVYLCVCIKPMVLFILLNWNFCIRPSYECGSFQVSVQQHTTTILKYSVKKQQKLLIDREKKKSGKLE